MGLNALLTGNVFADPFRWIGLTHCRFDRHPQTNALVLSIARRGKIHHADVPIGVTLTAAEIYELIARLLEADGPAEISAEPCAIAQRHPSSAPTIVGTSPP